VDEDLVDGIKDALMQKRKLGSLELLQVVPWDLQLAFESNELDDLGADEDEGQQSRAESSFRTQKPTFSAVLYFLINRYAVFNPSPTMLST
jgi:hypothetical protein